MHVQHGLCCFYKAFLPNKLVFSTSVRKYGVTTLSDARYWSIAVSKVIQYGPTLSVRSLNNEDGQFNYITLHHLCSKNYFQKTVSFRQSLLIFLERNFHVIILMIMSKIHMFANYIGLLKLTRTGLPSIYYNFHSP